MLSLPKLLIGVFIAACYFPKLDKGQPLESTWSLCGSRRDVISLRGVLQQELMENDNFPIPQENIAMFLFFTLSIYVLAIYFTRIVMVD
jgi:hypothetical protein